MAVPLVLVLGAVTVGIVTLSNESSVRDELINRVEPANAAALSLGTAVVDQETGIRGYELAATPSFLGPYTAGRAPSAGPSRPCGACRSPAPRARSVRW